jgi:RNA polymerase sigma-70 factor (ECF subfamily)
MADQLDPDAALMLRVKQGDAEAFEELVDRYKRPVLNLVYRMIGDPTEAEDLAQNVFVQVFKSSDRYRVSAKFSTWLFTIARNLCLNEIRRRKRHPADSLDAPNLGEEEPRQFQDHQTAAPGENVVESELILKIEEAVRDLPENQRTALLLFRDQELAYEDISEVIGCSLSATKSLIHRARETLKARLKPYLKKGDWQTEKEKL